MRQTGDSIIATIDTDAFLCLNNMHVLVPKEDNHSPKFILGILNSRLITWYYHILNPEVGEALAEVKKTNVAQLPIRTIDFTIPAEKAAHEKMVALVTSMLEMHKSKAGAKTQSEIDVYERQIRAVDGQIDNLVYELYGLSEEEIGIVEQK